MLPGGLRYPSVSPSLASERRAFSQKNLRTTRVGTSDRPLSTPTLGSPDVYSSPSTRPKRETITTAMSFVIECSAILASHLSYAPIKLVLKTFDVSIEGGLMQSFLSSLGGC
jgi:hypothetical protein